MPLKRKKTRQHNTSTNEQTIAPKRKDSISVHLKKKLKNSYASFLFISFSPLPLSIYVNRVAPGFSWRDLHSPSEGKSILSRSLSTDCPVRVLISLTHTWFSTAKYQRVLLSVDTLPLHYFNLAIPSFTLSNVESICLLDVMHFKC